MPLDSPDAEEMLDGLDQYYLRHDQLAAQAQVRSMPVPLTSD